METIARLLLGVILDTFVEMQRITNQLRFGATLLFGEAHEGKQRSVPGLNLQQIATYLRRLRKLPEFSANCLRKTD